MPLRLFAPRISILITLLTTLCVATAQARDPAPPSRSDGQRGGMDASRGRAVAEVDPQQQELLLRQKRRDNLRETLRGQGEEAPTATPAARQLSTQERIELRQQLRQQQEWLSK